MLRDNWYLALLFLTSVVKAEGGLAAPTCPTPSTTAINCIYGRTYTNFPSGGVCDCLCAGGSYRSTFTPDPTDNSIDFSGSIPRGYSTGLVDITIFAAASANECSANACISQFPYFCGGAGTTVSPTFFPSIAAMISRNGSAVRTDIAPQMSKVAGVGSICYAYSLVCDQHSLHICPESFMGTTVVTIYDFWNSTPPALDTTTYPPSTSVAARYCASRQDAWPQLSTTFTGATFCNTTNCNNISASELAIISSRQQPSAAPCAKSAPVLFLLTAIFMASMV